MLTPEQLQAEAWTWSFSKFSKFQECNEFYRLKYFEKIKVPPLSEYPFLQGRVAHKITEQTRAKLIAGEVASMAAVWDVHDDLFNHYAGSIHWKSDVEIIQARLESRQIVANYVQLIEEAGLLSGEVYCEYWFGTYDAPLIRPSGLRLVGALDWLKIDRATMTGVILDGKSSRSTEYLDKRQLIMYAMAIEQLFGVRIERVGYLMMRWERPLMYTITAEDKENLERELIRTSQAAAAGAFSVKPSVKMCATCQMNPHCGHYKTWINAGGMAAGAVDW